MTFWKAIEERPQQNKATYVVAKDLVELLDKKKHIGDKGDFKTLRFVGPFFGVKTINVPIIKNDRFIRKSESNRLVAIPKTCLGYDYATGALDEDKCPYLKHVNIHSPVLQAAVINYINDSSMKDKDALLSLVKARGVASLWGDKVSRELLQQNSKELADFLQPLVRGGINDFYCNVLLYPLVWNQQTIEMFANPNTRTESERLPVDFLDYSTTYGEKVFLKEKGSLSQTPCKVIKLSANGLEKFFKDVVKLNTVADAQGVEHIKGVEDPIYGCKINTRLEMTKLKNPFNGDATYSYVFVKGDRQALNDHEKQVLLWDLRLLQGEETKAQAEEFLQGCGWLNSKPYTSAVNYGDAQNSPNSFMAQVAMVAAPVVNSTGLVVNPAVSPVIATTTTNSTVAQVPVQPTVAVDVTKEPAPVMESVPVNPTVAQAPVTQAIPTQPTTPTMNFDDLFNS